MKVKELYEYVSKLMDENKGECPVEVNSVNADDIFEVVTPAWEGKEPVEFDNDRLWIQVISNREDCPCDFPPCPPRTEDKGKKSKQYR